MQRNQIWQQIELELNKPKQKGQRWPVHIVAQAANVSKASGQLVDGAIAYKYHRDKKQPISDAQAEAIVMDAIKTAVAAIRFLENINFKNNKTTIDAPVLC
jgi:hypothetical protein